MFFNSKKGSKAYRNTRRRHLKCSLEKTGDARMHAGAGNAREETFSFDEAYNSERQIEKLGERTKRLVRIKSEKDLEEAKNFIVLACSNCEFFPCHIKPDEDFNDLEVQKAFCAWRREFFWRYHDDRDVRRRINKRLDHPDVVSGKKSAPCATLAWAGRLKKVNWNYYMPPTEPD